MRGYIHFADINVVSEQLVFITCKKNSKRRVDQLAKLTLRRNRTKDERKNYAVKNSIRNFTILQFKKLHLHKSKLLLKKYNQFNRPKKL